MLVVPRPQGTPRLSRRGRFPAVLALMLVGLAGCGRLDAILVEPPLAPDQWCTTRPCTTLAGVVLDQPFGTLLVFALAGLYVAVGWQLGRSADAQRSRLWWSRSLVLGGIAAALAGTSYQAFGYELKCAGRAACRWTDWFEVVYMVLQNVSVDCMVVAVAYSCSRGRGRQALLAYAGLNAAAHLVVTVLGILQSERFLLSFELLLLFSTPAFFVALAINGSRYLRLRQPLDGALLGGWAWLFATNALYYAYLLSGFTDQLWQGGAGWYFSENDVLHVGMIGYVWYLHRRIAPHIRDLAEAA